MEIKRLKSYDFKCPCCSEPHRRQFDYLAKYMGFIPEVEPLPTDREVTMLDRATSRVCALISTPTAAELTQCLRSPN